ncbi:GDSL-type esterase/lipase family protein [Anaerolentibacter hominis]|uniref:GDSL-type esterase/lipase family protein n=1 Tax=Anaerolentibacter hominis TaxID=3079009 RepID=UPI0031B80A23
MKNIMCFGDSNTFGSNPSGGRWERYERWTGILQKMLGEDYYVIEEGHGGRTTVYEDPVEGNKCGKNQLIPLLSSHRPLDLVIVMLGTNDLKMRFGAPAMDIAKGAGEVVKIIRKYDFMPKYREPKILLAAPILIGEGIEDGPFGYMFDRTARERSLEFDRCFSQVAEEQGVFYMNAAEYGWPSKIDGLHMDKDSHQAMADAFYAQVKKLIG